MTAPARSTAHLTTTFPFEAPGPGSWELDLSHYSPDCSRISRDVIEVAFQAGLEEGFELVGAPVKGMEARFINGRFYRRLVPLVGADRNAAPPPDLVLKMATRVHPEFRRRAKTAARSLEDRVWLAELDRWETQWKPELVESNRRFGAVDLDGLDDAALADHIEELVGHLTTSTALHFRLHVSDLGPIGLLLIRGREWGIDAVDLMQTLAGFSHATSAPARALADIRQHLTNGASSLDDIRSAGAPAEAALDAFLAEYGSRLTGGYDLQDRTLGELPATIVMSINGAGTGPVVDSEAEGRRVADRLRADLPPGDHAEFDRLVADARALYGLRDENGPLTYQWPAGLLRRAMLEAAPRLTTKGALQALDHVFDLSGAELVAALRLHPLTTAAQVAGRHEARMSWPVLDAPRLLGPEPTLPSLDVLPGPLARLMDVVLTVLDLIESDLERLPLEGVGIGDESYTGRARVVSDAVDALAGFEPGDILVAPFTVPTINSVLAMAGAVVTEEGGLLCHAAVIAREFGIPGVVGLLGATTSIADGAQIEVDGASGLVRLI